MLGADRKMKKLDLVQTVLILAIAGFALSSCTVGRGYDGPERPYSEIALFAAYQQFSAWIPVIRTPDSKTGSHAASGAAGRSVRDGRPREPRARAFLHENPDCDSY